MVEFKAAMEEPNPIPKKDRNKDHPAGPRYNLYNVDGEYVTTIRAKTIEEAVEAARAKDLKLKG